MPITDLYDRNENYGHTAGTSTLKDDGSTAEITPPSFNSDSTATRLALSVATPNADSRKVGVADQHPDLYDRDAEYGHTAGDPDDSMTADLTENSEELTYTGSNTALDNTSTEAAGSNRTADVPSEAERISASIQDRTSGYGHTAGSVAAIHD